MKTIYQTMYATLVGRVDKALELVADALSHSRCDREHVNQIGEMLKAALLETEGMYLETGDGE